MELHDFILKAIDEDMPEGDITTDGLAVASCIGYARLVAKSDLVLSGIELFEITMKEFEPQIRIEWHFKPGQWVYRGSQICTIKGELLQILKAERIALNFLGHLSGIATLTNKYVKKIEGTKAKILDTRKTLPCYREWQRKAVREGGGFNHRLNLSDRILIKENHIRVAGGIKEAIKSFYQHQNSKPSIMVEVTNKSELEVAIELKVDRVLLDNMSNELMNELIALIPKKIEIEATGNMTLDRVKSVAELGVDYISVGGITHSAPNSDVSLVFDWDGAERRSKDHDQHRS